VASALVRRLDTRLAASHRGVNEALGIIGGLGGVTAAAAAASSASAARLEMAALGISAHRASA